MLILTVTSPVLGGVDHHLRSRTEMQTTLSGQLDRGFVAAGVRCAPAVLGPASEQVEGKGANRDMTQILELFSRDHVGAQGELLPVIYTELRRLAQSHMRRAGFGHTLQATALVHELWTKIAGLERKPDWPSRGHFFKWCSTVMGNLLRDYARKKRSQKSGGRHIRIALEGGDFAAKSSSIEGVIDVLDAIDDLSKVDSKLGTIVELRAVVGLTYREIASRLELSEPQVDSSLHAARAWLRVRLDVGT